MKKEFIIRKAVLSDLPTLLNILDSATLKLLKKGVMQWEYPWDSNIVASFIEKEEFYIAVYDGTACGCFGLKNFENNNFLPRDTDGLYWYHLAVHPDCAKIGIGYAICNWVQEYSIKTGRGIYFDCWAGNQSLRNYYTMTGFEPLGEFPEEDYFVAAFRFKK